MRYGHKIYMFLVILSGTGIFAFSLLNVWRYNLAAPLTAIEISNWIIMLVLLVLCRALPVYIARDKSIEVSFVPVVASAMVYGLYLTISMFSISTLFLYFHDKNSGKVYNQLLKNPVRELFNTSNIVVSIFIGGQLLINMGGYAEEFSFPFSILPASVFALVSITVNLLLFITYFVAEGKGHFATMISQTLMGVLPNVVSTIPIGIFIAVLLNLEHGSFFVLLFILPLLLARYSFILYWDSRSMHMRTITALTRAIDAKDAYTRGHSERVAEFAEEIAKYMGLSKKMIADIEIAALIHDIGKIGIEDNILNKPGRLDLDEFEQIKKHPVIGAEIIEEINFSKTIVDAVLYHHCNYDGSGYPCTDDKPTVQPLAAAILAIADAYDAMTSDRPYRKRMSRDDAVKILKENSGTQFNPVVVEAFCNII